MFWLSQVLFVNWILSICWKHLLRWNRCCCQLYQPKQSFNISLPVMNWMLQESPTRINWLLCQGRQLTLRAGTVSTVRGDYFSSMGGKSGACHRRYIIQTVYTYILYIQSMGHTHLLLLTQDTTWYYTKSIVHFQTVYMAHSMYVATKYIFDC